MNDLRGGPSHGPEDRPHGAPEERRAGGEPAARRPFRGRWVTYGAGTVLIGIGAYGLLTQAATTHPLGWLTWFAGAAIVHDGFVAPLVLTIAFLVGRLPEPWRRVTRAALVPAAAVTIVSLPMVLGLGRRADVPSRLPLAYGTNLAALLAAIVLTGAAVAVVSGSTAKPTTAARVWRLAAGAVLIAGGVGAFAAVVV
jgi:hypothetical protein